MNHRLSLKDFIIYGALICFLTVSCSSREIREEEKGLLVNVRDLEGYGVVLVDPSPGESYLVKTNPGGSTEIEYEYDSEKDPKNPDAMWIKSEAEIMDTIEVARESFRDRISAYQIGASLGGGQVEILEEPNLFYLGDESFSAYFDDSGYKFGNVLVIRQGRTVLSLLITGFYFDHYQHLHDLMSPKLEHVNTIID